MRIWLGSWIVGYEDGSVVGDDEGLKVAFARS
jgi:hypothetical protein